MSDQLDYEGIIAQLVATDPETLVNVFSRVLRDREDIEHLSTGTPETHSSVETGQLTVPGQVGSVSAVRNPDRLFTIAIHGQGRHHTFDQVAAEFGHTRETLAALPDDDEPPSTDSPTWGPWGSEGRQGN